MSSHLLFFPAEILVQIFCELDGFDTASRLAQTCTHLYGIWRSFPGAIVDCLLRKDRRINGETKSEQIYCNSGNAARDAVEIMYPELKKKGPISVAKYVLRIHFATIAPLAKLIYKLLRSIHKRECLIVANGRIHRPTSCRCIEDLWTQSGHHDLREPFQRMGYSSIRKGLWKFCFCERSVGISPKNMPDFFNHEDSRVKHPSATIDMARFIETIPTQARFGYPCLKQLLSGRGHSFSTEEEEDEFDLKGRSPHAVIPGYRPPLEICHQLELYFWLRESGPEMWTPLEDDDAESWYSPSDDEGDADDNGRDFYDDEGEVLEDKGAVIDDKGDSVDDEGGTIGEDKLNEEDAEP